MRASDRMKTVELYGTKVVPMVRELLAEAPTSAPRAGAAFGL